MKLSLFESQDYRTYLREALPTKGAERGLRTKLAAELGVQKGLVSSILSGSAELSLEQALKVSRFLGHTTEETDFFLLLVQCSRAGSTDLAGYYNQKREKMATERREIRGRIQTKENLSQADQLQYYSSWQFTAIHMCLMIPQLRTARSIASYLGLSLAVVNETLEFFVKRGIANQKGEEFLTGPTRIHVGSDSPLTKKHHINWRFQAAQSLDVPGPEDLHYSSVMSLSKSAAKKIRELLMQAIQDSEPVIKAAKDEEVFTLNLDLFCLKRAE